jgi:MFS family permease
MPIGLIVLALATASCAFANRLSHFYLLFGIFMPIGTSFCGWPLLAPALANWFLKRRGLVIGLGSMGGGLSFVFVMFAEFTIFNVGWRYAYFVLAGTLIVLILPLYHFFHYRPEKRNLKPYGADELLSPKDSASETRPLIKGIVPRVWTLHKALKTRQLWLMVFAYFLYWGIGVYTVVAHQVKYAQDAGYGGMFSASMLGLYGIFMAAGQMSASISDWAGREKTLTFATILSMSALVALLSVKDTSRPILLYVHAICFGYGAGLSTATLYAALADLFHGRHFGEIAGLLLTGQGIGGAIGPWLGGHIYDVSNSYRISLLICMICFASACIMVWAAAPRKANPCPI